jgi:hypothetical protein
MNRYPDSHPRASWCCAVLACTMLAATTAWASDRHHWTEKVEGIAISAAGKPLACAAAIEEAQRSEPGACRGLRGSPTRTAMGECTCISQAGSGRLECSVASQVDCIDIPDLPMSTGGGKAQ